MPACPKTCSLLFAGSPAGSGSSHAHCLPTKLLHPASVLLFTRGFLSNFSSVPNNLNLIICRRLTKTHVLTPSVVFLYALRRPLHIESVLYSFGIKFLLFNYSPGLSHLHYFLTKLFVNRAHDSHIFSVCQ